MRLVKSNESDRECKTKPTSKTNVEQMKKEKRRENGKLVISFMYVETMGVNGVDTPDPHLFSAETDRFPVVSKRLNALQDHVRNAVIKYSVD